MIRPLRLGRWALFVVLALTAFPASAQTTYTWTGSGSDANWSTAGNWTASAGSPPPASDLANTLLVLTGNTQLANTLDYDFSANSLTFDAGAGSFVVGGTNTLTIGTGGITVLSNNDQAFNANLALGAASTFANNGTGTFSVGGAVNNGGFLLTVGGTGNSTYGGVISGGGGLTKTDAGTVTLSGLNTYGGTTTISGGTLLAGVNNALSSASDVVLANTAGALLDLNNTTQTIKSLSGGGTNGGNVAIGSGSLTINGTGTTTFSGLFTGSGALSVTNAGKLTLRGDSTWTGPLNVSGGAVVSIDSAARLGPSGTANGQITLDNGTIEQTNPGTNGTFTPALRNITLGAGGGTLSYTTAGSQSIVQTGTVISGSGGLTKDGAGIIAVVTPATYTGPTHVVAGTLRVRTNNNVFPIATALTVDAGATFDLDVKSQEVGSLSGAGVVHINGATGSAQTFTVGNLGTSTTFSGSFTEGTITGGRVTKVGGGTLTLSGTSSYTGATTISGGILATNLLANGGTASGIGQSTSAAGNLVLDGGRLRYTGPAVSTDRLFTLNSTGGIIDARGTGPLMFTSTGTVGGPGTGTLTLTGTNTGANTLSPVLNGSNTAVIKTGAGTWILTGANSYGGATTISNGILSTNLMSTGGNPSGIGASSDAPNNLVLDGGTLQYTGPLVSTSRQFTLTQNGGGLDASGTGAIIYTSSSIIVLSGSGSRTLTLSGTNTGLNSLNGVISNGAGGATSLVKSGPGTWVLGGGGVNAYTGTTTVNGGTLVVSSGAWITSGATLSVNSTGTLAGTAGANQIASPVAINGGGAIRGGVTGGTGTLNVGNTVTVANNGTIRTEVSRTGANTATDSKIIINAGSLNLAPNAGDKFFIDIVNNGASPMIAGETYTITLASVASGVINVHGVAASGVISPSNYTLFSGMTTATGVSLTASGGNLNLTFTPVPEPTTVLGLTAGVLGLGRVVRRRLRGTQTV